MTKLKSIANKIFICILIIVSFFIAQNSVLFNQFTYASQVQTVSATTTTNTTSSNYEHLYSTISNYNFASTSSGAVASKSKTIPSNYTGNTSILTPSSWTKDGTANASMYIGVIDVSESSFATNYDNYKLKANEPIYKNSMASDTNTNVLMINSETATTFGYTSSSITLEPNSYYSITVDYFTGNSSTSNPLASVCLIGDDFNGLSSTAVLGSQTNKNWGTITFWIATNEANSSTVQVGLYLGCPDWTNSSTSTATAGYVLFDNVELTQYSENYFNSINKEADNYASYSTNQYVDLTYGNITSGDGYVTDGSFNTTTSLTSSSSAWTTMVDNVSTITGSSTINIINSNSNYYDIDAPYTNARTSDNKVLMVYNAINKTGSSSGSVTSSAISIKQHTVYRISFWAKTNSSTIIATLTPTGKVNGNTYSAVSITTANTSTNTTTNDWKEYVFFVTGNSLTDAKVTLTLGLSSSSNDEAEYAFFDDITSQQVSTEDRDNASSLSISYTTLDLNSTSSLTIANGYFNVADSIDREVTYPLEVSGWTYTGITNSSNAHGIVNLQTDIFNANKENFGNAENPAEDSSISSNVLMLYNNAKTTQAYTTSSTISASATTTYEFSIDICTNISSQNSGGANVYITNSDGITIAQFLDINTGGQWKTYTLYFKNYGEAQTLNVTLGFGRDATNKMISGWAYFDNCVWNTYSGTTTIEDISTTATTKVVNLAETVDDNTYYYSDTFSEYDTDVKDSSTNLYTPLYWDTKVKAEETDDDGNTTTLSDEDIFSGIVTANNIDKALVNQRVNADINREFYMIRSLSDTYYTTTNKLTIPLSASSYYKVSVWVKTVGLTQNSNNIQYDDDDVAIPYGASIIIDGLDKSFTGINTNGTFGENDNGWVQYIFYINTTDAMDMELSLGLGSEDAWTSGYVFFDDITVLSMTEDAYTLALNIDVEKTPDQVVSIVNTTTDDEDTDTSSSSTYAESWAWLAIPTVIMAVAIIVAIAGYCIRKYREKRPIKVKVISNYDRSSTLLKDLDHRNYKASVHHRLKLLYEELRQTEQYLEEERDEHKKQMEAYETAKEIAEQDKSIQLETPNKKYMDFDKTVEQLKNNIASIKTDIELLEEEERQIIEHEQKVHKEDLKGNKITRRK